MGDNDLIRRGDALAACAPHYQATLRALPAASAEDVRAGALKEAAALVMQTHRPPSIVKDFRDGYDVAKAEIAGAILALIPGAKP